MKGLICYHSNTGNTKAVVKFLTRQISGITCDTLEVAREPLPDLSAYDVVGFVTWTYYLSVPPLFAQWMETLPDLPGKPVFLLNTYGVMPGWTLKRMAEAVTQRGAVIVGAFSFHTPESYPPFIAKGWDSAAAPEPDDLTAFASFVSNLETQLERIGAHQMPDAVKMKLGFFDYVIRPYSVEKARRKMGSLVVDAAACTGCETCATVCHYGAITFEDRPQFDTSVCHACFACFNQCPEGAISTDKLKGVGQYTGPDAALLAKLGQ